MSQNDVLDLYRRITGKELDLENKVWPPRRGHLIPCLVAASEVDSFLCRDTGSFQGDPEVEGAFFLRRCSFVVQFSVGTKMSKQPFHQRHFNAKRLVSKATALPTTPVAAACLALKMACKPNILLSTSSQAMRTIRSCSQCQAAEPRRFLLPACRRQLRQAYPPPHSVYKTPSRNPLELSLLFYFSDYDSLLFNLILATTCVNYGAITILSRECFLRHTICQKTCNASGNASVFFMR